MGFPESGIAFIDACIFIDNFCFQNEWMEGYQLAAQMNFKFPQFTKTSFSVLIPNSSNEGVVLMEHLLLWHPSKRPTAQQALR